MSQTLGETEESALPVSGPILLDGMPTRAPVVVTLRGDHAALWLVDLAGAPCGAWALPAATPGDAHKILSMCDRRALIAVDVEGATDAVLGLAKTAGVDIARSILDARICSIPGLLTETADARNAHGRAVRDIETQSKKRLAPLVWDRPIPDAVHTTHELMAAAGIRPMGSPETADALALAHLARWAIRLWVNTETIRARRSYLREQFGPAQSLPKSWRKAITGAFAEPFSM